MRRIISARNRRITRSTFHDRFFTSSSKTSAFSLSFYLSSLHAAQLVLLSTGIFTMSYGVTYRLAWKRLARVGPEFHANGNGPNGPDGFRTVRDHLASVTPRSGTTWCSLTLEIRLSLFHIATKCLWHELGAKKKNYFNNSREFDLSLLSSQTN